VSVATKLARRGPLGPTVPVVRRVVVILASLASVGAGVSVWTAHAVERDCRTTLHYAGVSYSVVHVTEEIGGTGLGVGTQRGWGAKGRWSEDVAVSRIAGVDPRTALAAPVAVDVLNVARDVTVSELSSDLAELVGPWPLGRGASPAWFRMRCDAFRV
jgi:hypothetical protein